MQDQTVEITEEQVRSVIKNMKKKKRCGEGGRRNEACIYTTDNLISQIVKII